MENNQFAEQMTPLDLLMPKVYIGSVLIFETSKPTNLLLPNLQRGLDNVSKEIPWLSGRVVPTLGAPNSAPGLEIRWDAKDTALQVLDRGSIPATYDQSYRGQMPLKNIPAEAWPISIAIDANQTEAPVFAAGVFRFADGNGVGLCICVHHNAVDGYGFAQIVKLWAQYMAHPGLTSSTLVPELKRDSRLAKAFGQNFNARPLQPLDNLFQLHPEYSREPPRVPDEFPLCTSEIFRISMSKIERFRELVKRYDLTPPTTNTLACALLWSAVTRTRMQRQKDLGRGTSRLAMAVNGRNRLGNYLLGPEKPYPGNIVLFSLAELSAQDVAESTQEQSHEFLANVCDAIYQSQSSSRINASHISQVCDLVTQIDDYRGIFPGWDLFGSRDLFITSWADLDLYKADFGDGLGKPQFVRIPYAEADSNVIILPRKRADSENRTTEESIEAVIMLRRDDMDILKQDGLFGGGYAESPEGQGHTM